MPPDNQIRLLQDYAARIEKLTKRVDRLETLEFSSTAFPSGGMVCIETVKLAAPAASVTLPTPAATIAANWWHLWLWMSAKAEPDTVLPPQPLLRFNADAGANYYSYKNIWTRDQAGVDSMTSVGSAVATATGISLQNVGGAQDPEDDTSRNGCEINIYDYRATDMFKTVTWKGWHWSTVDPETGAATINKGLGGGIWRSLAAITSLTLVMPSNAFDTGSVFTLMAICSVV